MAEQAPGKIHYAAAGVIIALPFLARVLLTAPVPAQHPWPTPTVTQQPSSAATPLTPRAATGGGAPKPAPATPSLSGSTGWGTPVVPPTPTPGRAARVSVPAPDPSNPDAVASAFAATLFSFDTVTDPDTSAAATRAARYAADPLKANLVAQRGRGGSTADWAALATAHGYTTAAVTLSRDGSPAGSEQSLVEAAVQITGHGDQGDVPDAFPAMILYLTLTHTDGQWRITGCTFRT